MSSLRLLTTAFALLLSAAVPARGQATVIPDKATAQCNDGTWSMAASRRGACAAHQGVKHWIGKRPRGATARCNDGEYWLNPTMQGACSSHGGVYKAYKKAEKAERKAAKREMKEEEKNEKREMKAEKKDAKDDRKPEKKPAKP